MLQEELNRILNGASGERRASAFLARNPEIVRWAFCWTGGHSTYVVKEFPFGSRYRADLVVPLSYSGAWEVHMIELEPPNDSVINKDGTPSQRLNKAMSQIQDWREYIERNPDSIRKDLSDWCVKHDRLRLYDDHDPPCNETGDYLSHPDTYIVYEYHIVIGMRESVSREKRRKMNQYSGSMDIDICTYGRFLDIARNFDRHYANPRRRLWLTKRKE